MPQFDVHRNLGSAGRSTIPYLLDVQSDLLDGLATRVVVPLIRATDFGPPAARLNPVFEIEGQRMVLSTAELAGIPRGNLGEVVASLDDSRDELIAALDFVIQGF